MHRTVSLLTLAVTVGVALAAAAFATTLPASAGGGGCHAPLTDTKTTSIDMKDNCFASTIARVGISTTVTWRNRDAVPHTVSGANGSWSATHGKPGDEIYQGGTVSYKFERAGLYLYYCALHPSMIGAVVVGDDSAGTQTPPMSGPLALDARSPGPDSGRIGLTTALLGAGLSLGVVAAGAAGYGLSRRRTSG